MTDVNQQRRHPKSKCDKSQHEPWIEPSITPPPEESTVEEERESEIEPVVFDTGINTEDQDLVITWDMNIKRIHKRYQKKLNAHKLNLDKMEKIYLETKNKIAQNEAYTAAAALAKDKEMSDQRIKLKRLDNQVKGQRAKLAALNQYIINMREGIIVNQEQAEEMRESGQITEDHDEFMDLLTDKENQAAGAEELIAELGKMNIEIRESNRAKRRSVTQMIKDRAPFERELRKKEQANEEIEDRNVAVERTIPVLKDELEYIKARIAEVNEATNEIHEENNKLREEIKENYNELKALNIQASALLKEKDGLEPEFSNQSYNLITLRNKNKSLVSTFIHQGLKTEHILNIHQERTARFQKIYDDLASQFVSREQRSKENLQEVKIQMTNLSTQLEVNRKVNEKALTEIEEQLKEQIPDLEKIIAQLGSHDRVMTEMFNEILSEDKRMVERLAKQKAHSNEICDKLRAKCNVHLSEIDTAINKMNNLKVD